MSILLESSWIILICYISSGNLYFMKNIPGSIKSIYLQNDFFDSLFNFNNL